MSEVLIRTTIDSPWIHLEPIRVGAIPGGEGTPDCYVTVETMGKKRLRIDVYTGPDRGFVFEKPMIWGSFVVIGLGNYVYLVCLKSLEVRTFDLGNYLSQLWPTEEYLLVASAERLFQIERSGSLKWSSERLGVDGVRIVRVHHDAIDGEGEWNPPGGWKPFRVNLKSGSVRDKGP